MSILSDRKDISENKLILRSLTFFNELEQRYNNIYCLRRKKLVVLEYIDNK